MLFLRVYYLSRLCKDVPFGVFKDYLENVKPSLLLRLEMIFLYAPLFPIKPLTLSRYPLFFPFSSNLFTWMDFFLIKEVEDRLF